MRTRSQDDKEWMKHTISYMASTADKVKIDYRPVHYYTLDEEVQRRPAGGARLLRRGRAPWHVAGCARGWQRGVRGTVGFGAGSEEEGVGGDGRLLNVVCVCAFLGVSGWCTEPGWSSQRLWRLWPEGVRTA